MNQRILKILGLVERDGAKVTRFSDDPHCAYPVHSLYIYLVLQSEMEGHPMCYAFLRKTIWAGFSRYETTLLLLLKKK